MRAFEAACLRAISPEHRDLPFGQVLRAPGFGKVYDHNLVEVAPGERPPVAEVLAKADEHLGDLTHRTVRYADGGDAMDEVEDAFAEAGYGRDSWVVMALESPASAVPVDAAPEEGSAEDGGSGARQLTTAEFEELMRLLNADRPWAGDPELDEMFVRFGHHFLAATDAIPIGSFDRDGRPVGGARVMGVGSGSVRQIEEVEVVEAARGTGAGRAVMAASIARAVVDDPDLVFLVADQDDWPLDWYRRLGFVPIARTGQFQRAPD